LTLAPTERAETYLPVVEELLAGARAPAKEHAYGSGHGFDSSKYLCVGQREHADAVFAQMHATAERTGNEVLLVSWQAMGCDGACHRRPVGRGDSDRTRAHGPGHNEAGVASRGHLLASIADMGRESTWVHLLRQSSPGIGHNSVCRPKCPKPRHACFWPPTSDGAEVSKKLEQLVINRPGSDRARPDAPSP